MLMIKILSEPISRHIKTRDGREFDIQYQEAEMIREKSRPRFLEISVPKNGQPPYPKGLYTVSANSFRTDEYDRLHMKPYPLLIPLDQAVTEASDILKFAGKKQ